MSTNLSKKRLGVLLGTVFLASMASTTSAAAGDNPFGISSLSGGKLMLAEGKCGGGKCGGGKGPGGKCGMSRMDADGDGNVTRDEFMKGHEVMFDKIDKNNDGVIDPEERRAHMQKMRGFMKDGKCGDPE